MKTVITLKSSCQWNDAFVLSVQSIYPSKDKLCKFCWFSPVVLKKNIKFCQCIVAISLLSPLAKNAGPSFEQIWVLITQGFIVRSLVEIGQVVREKIFLTSSMHFRYVVIIYLWKRAGPFIWIKLNPL